MDAVTNATQDNISPVFCREAPFFGAARWLTGHVHSVGLHYSLLPYKKPVGGPKHPG